MKFKFILLLTLLLTAKHCFSQVEVIGKVIDKVTNQPITGANISITNTTYGAISDIDGMFHLKSDTEIESITVSFIGYKNEVINKPSQEIIINLTPTTSELDEVVIKGAYTKPVKRTSDAIYTGSALTDKGISLMGISASNSVYNAIDLMPGISVESNDAYGLSEKSVRIRCIKDNFSGMTLDGFPNYGIMPIGARDDIYDMENMHQVAVYKGATPADLGTATGSKGGAIELQFRRPQENFGIQINQSVGMNNYTRSFARIDLGQLPSGTGAFISYSYTQADKWKGLGKLGPRNNLTIGITQQITNKIDFEVFANYNSIDRHDFKPLSYEQARDIKNTYSHDFNSSLTGTPANDMNYFDYNGGKFINRDIMSKLSFRMFEYQKVTLRYYISSEDADFKEGVKKGPNYFVFNRKRDVNRMGVIPEFSGELFNIKYSAGYWFESCDNNASVYSLGITADGLQPIGYNYFTVNEKKGQVHSPYAKIAYTLDKLSFQAGIKYFYYIDPESNRYTSETPTELSAIPDPDLHTDKISHSSLLPTAGFGYKFNKKVEAYFNYGKNYMRPYKYSPIISLYVKNQKTFTDNGMTLQSVFDKWIMETSDNFDIGIRYKGKKVSFSPSVFYAKHHNVLASAYDPVVELDYYQNVGKLTAYGADMECYIFPVNKLMLYLNPTFARMSYDEDLYRKTTDGFEGVGIKGKQAPTTPKFSLKTGGSYSIKNISFATKVKCIGARYGDASNVEEISGYTLIDASVNYCKKDLWKLKELCIGVEFKNIFNTRYVGSIDVSDDSLQGSASYYAGIPFTAIGNLNLKF
jgi:iron complex outermembrane receptor protein